MSENIVLKSRKYRNLTQQQLADIMGADRTTISKMENKSANPTVAMLEKLASAMDMTLKIEFIPNEEIKNKESDVMLTNISATYLTNRDWFRSVLQNEKAVLCHTSALECLELFSGYMNEKTIEVYATKQGNLSDVNYRIISNFDTLDVVKIGDLYCTSPSQTIDDMLSDFENTDEQALVEGLSCYYYTNNSFEGITVKADNLSKFEDLKKWALEYYEVS